MSTYLQSYRLGALEYIFRFLEKSKYILYTNIYVIKTRLLYVCVCVCLFVCLFVCLSGLCQSDGGIETAFIIEIKTNFQMLL